MTSGEELEGETGLPARNAIAGDASAVVQGATITGGVHFYGLPTASWSVGRRIAKWDPFDLDVHRAIVAPASSGELPRLPRYVRREHDDQVDAVLGDETGPCRQQPAHAGG